MNLCKCLHCGHNFKSQNAKAKYCARKDCQEARRKHYSEYRKTWRMNNPQKVKAFRAIKAVEVKSMRRENIAVFKKEPCICGCGKSRKQNRWYAPDCHKYITSGDVLGGLARHNGTIMGR